MNRRWTKQEEIYLVENYGVVPTKDIAAFLKMKFKAVRNKIDYCKLDKMIRRRWDKKDIELIRRHIHWHYLELAVLFYGKHNITSVRVMQWKIKKNLV